MQKCPKCKCYPKQERNKTPRGTPLYVISCPECGLTSTGRYFSSVCAAWDEGRFTESKPTAVTTKESVRTIMKTIHEQAESLDDAHTVNQLLDNLQTLLTLVKSIQKQLTP